MMSGKIIYVADDEPRIRDIICSFLQKEGFEAVGFADGESVAEAFRQRPPDMLILDVMMPGTDGLSLCRQIRGVSRVPIIIVSARDSEADRIAGLNTGSDDYMVKPFSPLELVARVHALFRRTGKTDDSRAESSAGHDSTPAAAVGDITILPALRQVRRGDLDLHLTAMEYLLLSYLAANRSRAVSRDELLHRIWGFEAAVDTRAADDMVKRIRRKLAEAGSRVRIETIWGYGFRIREEN